MSWRIFLAAKQETVLALLDDDRVLDRVLVEHGFGQAYSARIPDRHDFKLQRLSTAAAR